jgi:hypothetical protein
MPGRSPRRTRRSRSRDRWWLSSGTDEVPSVEIDGLAIAVALVALLIVAAAIVWPWFLSMPPDSPPDPPETPAADTIEDYQRDTSQWFTP